MVNLSSLCTKFSVASVWCIQNQLATSGTKLGELKFFSKYSNIMAFSVLNIGVYKPAIATFYEHNRVMHEVGKAVQVQPHTLITTIHCFS